MSKSDEIKRINRIRTLNDFFRTSFIGGQVVLSADVSELPMDVKSRLVLEVQKFANFTPDNDPFAEHDFGDFELDGDKFFWKIDYYDKSMEQGSEDPSDPEKTTRVLTVAYMSEY